MANHFGLSQCTISLLCVAIVKIHICPCITSPVYIRMYFYFRHSNAFIMFV